MATPEDVQKLAALARISLPEERLAQFASEFDAIISYVDQLRELSTGEVEPLLPYENVMREDGEPHPRGIWTKKLADAFPEREGDSLSVKPIITHD